MPDVTVDSPFGGQAIAEVPLGAAPLVRVISQIRFPRLAAIATDDTVVKTFISAMAPEYPVLSEQSEISVTITPEGVSEAPSGGRLWQLQSGDGAWTVSVADSFLAVDTSMYSSRAQFRERVTEAWRRFEEIVNPPAIERIGVRYINRIADRSTLQDLPSLVRDEVLGGVTVAMAEGVSLGHSMHEALYHLGKADGLQVRWGVLPPGAVLDPTLPAVSEPSWVLDLDAFCQRRMDSTTEIVSSQIEELAVRAYNYFRWVVKPAFLDRFKGDDR